MNRQIALGVAFAATIIVAACSATRVPTPAPMAPPGAVAPPSEAPPSTAPTAAAASVVPLLLVAAESPAETIHLSLHPINDTVGSLAGCSNPGSCQGDFWSATTHCSTSRPASRSERSRRVLPRRCRKHPVRLSRRVTITLTGRGQIVFTEVIQHEPGKPPAVAPITGGTGELLGVTGEVTARVLSGRGDFVVTIR